MKKNLILFVVSLLIICAFSIHKQSHKGFPPCQKTTYSFSTFALTWLGEYCSESSCDRNWKNVWDGKSFFIHGYWPASTNLAFLSCQNQNKYDPYCYTNFNFSLSNLKNINDLNKYWPQVGTVKNFWNYQWVKHGTCYLFLTLQQNSNKLSKTQIFQKYFQQAIAKFKQLSLTQITKFSYSTKKQLGIQLGLYEDQFFTVCGNDNQIDQIRVCYNIAQPGKEKIIPCPSKPKQCRFPVVLKNK